jgi:predicted glutamine amidotransferase
MCRFLGCVASAPVTVRHELLEAPSPLIRQAEEHDSGWGMAVHSQPDGRAPELLRVPEAAGAGEEFARATTLRGRIFNVHVRRATMGGLGPANTHPFASGPVSLSHNGTVVGVHALELPPDAEPAGETDTERLFIHLMRGFDPDDVPGSLRRTVAAALATGPLSGINLLLADGRRLYAYRLGVFELHWLARPGQLLVASERVTHEDWHAVDQDRLLTLDPASPAAPRIERLVGDAALERASIVRFKEGTGLRGEERGAFAAARAARLSAAAAGG